MCCDTGSSVSPSAVALALTLYISWGKAFFHCWLFKTDYQVSYSQGPNSALFYVYQCPERCFYKLQFSNTNTVLSLQTFVIEKKKKIKKISVTMGYRDCVYLSGEKGA